MRAFAALVFMLALGTTPALAQQQDVDWVDVTPSDVVCSSGEMARSTAAAFERGGTEATFLFVRAEGSRCTYPESLVSLRRLRPFGVWQHGTSILVAEVALIDDPKDPMEVYVLIVHPGI